MTVSTRKDLEVESFAKLFLRDTPLMDVRAPVEFTAGAFPGARNVPLLDDEQRHQVGAEYAANGQSAAIELGNRLATDQVRAQHLQAWTSFINANPNGYLYCFRGGLRSQITQRWLAGAGYHYPLIRGGYKALRRYLLSQLDRLCTKGNIILLSGATGVGKTELIQAHASAIDLEGRANHRGSAFGRTFSDQPSQIDWENRIIIDWLKCEAASNRPVLIEAESHQIGRIHVPEPLQQAMARAPVFILEASLQERTERLFNDYVSYNLKHFQTIEEDPWAALQSNIHDNLTRIRKRLGGIIHEQLCKQLPGAVSALRTQQNRAGFDQIIEVLLKQYYDRMYQYHQDRNRARIVLQGNMSFIKEYLAGGSTEANERRLATL